MDIVGFFNLNSWNMKKFLECDLEEIIFTTPKEKLQDRGLRFFGKKARQLRIGNYGVADIITVQKTYLDHPTLIYPQIIVTVFELKKDKIGISAFLQALKYVKGIKSYIKKRGIKADVRFGISLIGSKVDFSGSFIYLTDLINSDNLNALNFVDFYTYSYKVDGIEFKKLENYSLTEEGF